MLDFAALSQQVMQGLSDDEDSGGDDAQSAALNGTSSAPPTTSVPTSQAEDINALLSSLIASQEGSASATLAPAPDEPAVAIDPVLESLAASLATTPMGSPQIGSSSASTSAAKRPGPVPSVFEARTYSNELPQFTDGNTLSSRAAGKRPDRDAPAQSPVARPNGQTAGPRKQPLNAPPAPGSPASINYAKDLDELQTMENGEPPNYPWWAIIRAAILGSPWGALTKREIVQAILAKWPAFHKRGENLTKAITYNLRSKACFVRCRMQGQGRTSFYIADSQTDGGRPKPQPTSRGKNKNAKTVYTHRFSPSVAAARNQRSGVVPPFLPSRPATVATPDAVQQAVQAALSQLTGKVAPTAPSPKPPTVECRAQGPNLISRMRFANGENSDEDPDPSDVDNGVSSDEEDDDEEVPDGGESGPRPGSSLMAIADPSEPDRRAGGLGSSLAAITGGASASASRYGRRPDPAPPARATARAAANAYPSLDAQIAATLAGVISMGVDASDTESEAGEESPSTDPPAPQLAETAPPTAPNGLDLDLGGVDFAAMQKEIEDSTSDEDEEEGEAEEAAAMDINALLGEAIAQATGQPSQKQGSKRSADDAELDPPPQAPVPELELPAAPASSSSPDQTAILSLLHDIVHKAGESAKVDVPKELPGLLSAALAHSGFTFTGQPSPTSVADAVQQPVVSAAAEIASSAEAEAPVTRVAAPPIIGRMPVPTLASRPSQPAAAPSPSSPHVNGRATSDADTTKGKEKEKPKATYPELAKEAINSVPEKQLVASDIFRIIEERYPYFVDAPEGWRATLRNVLTSHSCFVKVARPQDAPGRGDFWAVVEVPTWKRRRTTAKAKREERQSQEAESSPVRATRSGKLLAAASRDDDVEE